MNIAGWSNSRLDELGFVARGKSRHRPRNDPRLFGGPYPFVQTADIMAADPYISTYNQTLSEFGLAQSKLWPSNTLCITIAGANTAKTAIIKFGACFPDSVVGFQPDERKCDLYFVKYALDLMRDRFLAVTRGATQDNLSLDKLLSFLIAAPPVALQRKIGFILSSYDELLAVNKRRIAVLEEMAQRLFRHWIESSKTTPARLGSLVCFSKGRKPRETHSDQRDKDVPLLLIDALRGGAPAIFAAANGCVLAEPSDTIMVMDGGSSCEVAIGYAGAIGSTLGRFRPNDSAQLSPYLLYRYLEIRQEEFASKNIGAAIPHANKDYILNQEFPVFSADENLRFHQALEPLHFAIANLRRQSKVSRAARDLLLPKLISGEIDLEQAGRDAERIVRRVAAA